MTSTYIPGPRVSPKANGLFRGMTADGREMPPRRLRTLADRPHGIGRHRDDVAA